MWSSYPETHIPYRHVSRTYWRHARAGAADLDFGSRLYAQLGNLFPPIYNNTRQCLRDIWVASKLFIVSTASSVVEWPEFAVGECPFFTFTTNYNYYWLLILPNSRVSLKSLIRKHHLHPLTFHWSTNGLYFRGAQFAHSQTQSKPSTHIVRLICITILKPYWLLELPTLQISVHPNWIRASTNSAADTLTSAIAWDLDIIQKLLMRWFQSIIMLSLWPKNICTWTYSPVPVAWANSDHMFAIP